MEFNKIIKCNGYGCSFECSEEDITNMYLHIKVCKFIPYLFRKNPYFVIKSKL